MKNNSTVIRRHIHDNTTVIRRHLRDNSGDGYVWFLIMTIAFLLIFGALFMIMHTAAEMRDVRNGMDEAAMDMFAEIREVAYDKITDGATDDSFTRLTNADVMKKLAQHLNATFDEKELKPYIYKLDARNQLSYRIDDFEFTYIPQVNALNNAEELHKVGDVDGNKVVDEADVAKIEEYIKTCDTDKNGEVDSADIATLIAENPSNAVTIQNEFNSCDIRKDNAVNEKDVLLVKGVVSYFAEHPSASNEGADDKKSGLLMITCRITVNISYGTVHVGNSVDDYCYYGTISFKAAG